MSYYNDPLFQEGYALAQKKNRTQQEDRRLAELIEIGRRQDYNQAKLKAGPTQQEKAEKVKEFLNILDSKPSDRYNRQSFKKINQRYGSEEIN